MSRRRRREEYTVGWICALPVELAAAQEMLDEEHEDLERDDDDDKNLYSLGSIAGHNVVIVCLPAGRIGNNPAAAVATQMRATFKGIRFGLMVGIGGGVPGAEVDIRLGDVVVSQPHQAFGGVVQYDLGKATPSHTGQINLSYPRTRQEAEHEDTREKASSCAHGGLVAATSHNFANQAVSRKTTSFRQTDGQAQSHSDRLWAKSGCASHMGAK